ncbi:BRO family protein [Pleionea sp. CnH1-48]|uniref:BRO family protein n=1 Tax=Pleionea sp. CnH1-48 TaxID=2954494 RepID=UPI002096A147|nr:phage antirepressor KilAC domain-containing protein [Pleionea sp. CnH1-48]MCO7225919.1 BRO family protein [Pleionea sp. CnH1-48]
MQLIPFEFDDHNIRVIEQDGEPWFVAKDVASTLGYSNLSRDIARHCKSLKILKSTETVLLDIPPRGLQIIPERDVYRLIMRSKLPSAEKFENWVVSEVLPSIRKTGAYEVDPASIDYEKALEIALDATRKVKALEHQVEVDKPKVRAFDQLVDAKNTLTFREAAKRLSVRPKELKIWMLNNGWIYLHSGSVKTAYQDKLNAGLLVHKSYTKLGAHGYCEVYSQVRVTPKGLAKLSQHDIAKEWAVEWWDELQAS